MKILLVTRGSQGDVYPYLALAKELKNRGHDVLLSLPRLFESLAKDAELNYFLQAFDDIAGMVEGKPSTKDLIEWTKRVIKSQFDELIPLLGEYDMLVCSNTEFAAAHIAEYCGKAHIRTGFAPLLPGKKMPPPVFPFSPKRAFVGAQWGLLNLGLNMMVKKPLNEERRKLKMPPIKDQGEYAPSHALNYLMCSQYLGETDPNWKYPWAMGGYCFNDNFLYNEIVLRNFLKFVKKDQRPTLFFTLGSCNDNERDSFCAKLHNICLEEKYKFVVGCGWWKTGTHLRNHDGLFLLDTAIPHALIFPHCDAIIHHGGSGTTHSAARAGKPQMVAPLLIDQFYWGGRVFELQIGPKSVKLGNISEKALRKRVLDLMTNPLYKKNAANLAEKVRSEKGLAGMADYIEQLGKENKLGLKLAALS
ncbi:MAG: glycosyltransferase [Treponema sp.]|jgi:UDP:flavonoid glycosyltransferase YjiC (YdhE family)|nr:glycosyltransferase [Treponema sp.]